MRCKALLLRLVRFPGRRLRAIANTPLAKKAVKDNSVEKDIAQFIKKEVSLPPKPHLPQQANGAAHNSSIASTETHGIVSSAGILGASSPTVRIPPKFFF